MLKLTGYFTGFSSKADGSAGLRFSTQELSADQFAELKRELNNYGHILFKGNEIDLSDIPKEDAEDKEKTPSKRLREAFYRAQMEKIIEHIKTKLD